MLPGICGILAGSLYRLNVFRIRRVKVAPIFSVFLISSIFCICIDKASHIHMSSSFLDDTVYHDHLKFQLERVYFFLKFALVSSSFQ